MLYFNYVDWMGEQIDYNLQNEYSIYQTFANFPRIYCKHSKYKVDSLDLSHLYQLCNNLFKYKIKIYFKINVLKTLTKIMRWHFKFYIFM